MFIEKLAITDFRNLRQVKLEFNQPFIVISGPNGSGKSSLLEAIYFLAMCRSFRAAHTAQLIHENSQQFALHAQVAEQAADLRLTTQLGVLHSRADDTQISIDGMRTSRLSDLADHICIQLIYPHSSDIFEEPNLRRNFMDWGAYYHFREFRDDFSAYRKCLRQRNALLKRTAPVAQITVWDEQLAGLAEQINAWRTLYLERFLEVVQPVLAEFLPGLQIAFDFYPGYPAHERLRDLLSSSFARDCLTGFTYFGCHRADLKIKIGRHAAADFLSRGQLKLLICAMRLAQAMLLCTVCQRSSIFLIDDLCSELDGSSQQLLISQLCTLDFQVFVTDINNSLRLPCASNSFEVLEGHIEPC